MIKTKLAFIVTIDAPTGYHDQIVSLKPTLLDAVKDGLRWYRASARHPKHQPAIKAERTQVLG